MTPDERVKILDFGLAQMEPQTGSDETKTTPLTDPGTAIGTVAYMSPEQARGQGTDARGDLWSLGVVLYELSTGTRPFEGSTSAVLFDGILNRTPAPVRERNSKVPPELERIVGKLLEKDRAMRYQSAADLGADLKRVDRDSSSVAIVSRPTSKEKYAIAAAAVVLIAVGAFLWAGRTKAAPLTDKDVLVLADFTNDENIKRLNPENTK